MMFEAFLIVRNDGTTRSLVYLCQLKHIFGRQLPKMPKEYIARLVFDRKHKSIVCLRNGFPIGGITYKPFFDKNLAEIAFCAIISNEQVKGFGSIVMNHLKEYVKKEKIFHFLTYADNFAVGFFKRQGFTLEINMPASKWKGYVKDYDGGTLMHCLIEEKVNYLTIRSTFREQKAFLEKRLETITNMNVVHRGLTHFARGEYIDAQEIEGIRESGWIPLGHVARDKLEAAMKAVLLVLKHSTHSWPFLKPVDTVAVWDYLSVIKNPCDISLVEERLNSGKYYIAKEIFIADVQRIFDNCRLYNAPDTTYYSEATLLEIEFRNALIKHDLGLY
jgi:histone acetyltransferase